MHDNLTKIVATIGPAVENKLEEFILSGVNVVRFNFKHNSVRWHQETIKKVQDIIKKTKKTVGILIDLQGPEVRIKMQGVDEIEVEKGEMLGLGDWVYRENVKGFNIDHSQIIKSLENNITVLADDGNFVFKLRRKGDKVYLESYSAGTLKNNKTINIPDSNFKLPTLEERDYEGIRLAKEFNIQYIAMSFVRRAHDVKKMRSVLKKEGVMSKIISKIEAKAALSKMDEIIDFSDGIMVARGDMGVEIPVEKVPYYQKLIIEKCLHKGKPVITATQMLQSMINNPFPTRAEVSDVATAVYEFTDAVMLSGETASGKYPLRSIHVMRKTVSFNEKRIKRDVKSELRFSFSDKESVLVEGAFDLFNNLRKNNEQIAGFLVFTQTGRTAKLLSRYRPIVPIFVFAPDDVVSSSMVLSYGVKPFTFPLIAKEKEVVKDDLNKAVSILRDRNFIEKGDSLIVLHGDYWAKEGRTSTIRVIEV